MSYIENQVFDQLSRLLPGQIALADLSSEALP